MGETRRATRAIGAPLWAWRHLVRELMLRLLRRRYRGHVLGAAWPFLNPLAQLAIYTLVFSVFIGLPAGVNRDWDVAQGPGGHWRFALIAYAGLLPFLYFTDVLAASSRLIRNEPNYVRKTVFPLEVFGPVLAGGLLLELAIGFGLLLALKVVLWGALTWHVLLLPLALLPLVLFALAFAWALSALGAYVPDIGELVQMFLRVYFFLTPIVYPVELVPRPWQYALYLNPLASILHGVRNVALFGDPLVWPSWALVTLVGLACAVAAKALFDRLRPGFADVL